MLSLKKIAYAAAILMSLSVGAEAAPIVLTFEGIADLASVNDFYNGGTDSSGNSGTNYGINFSNSSLAIIDSDEGGGGSFANEPSASTVLFFLSGEAATMNVAAGFNNGFSFFYSGNLAGSVKVYDGLNATGNLLAYLDLAVTDNSNCEGDPTGVYCNFTSVGVAFSGIAKSVDFGGSANFIGFDNITLGSDTPGNPTDVPEPATLALSALGLAGLGVLRRKRKV